MTTPAASRTPSDIDTYFAVIHKHTPDNAVIGLTTIVGTYVANRWYQKRHIARLIDAALGVGTKANVYARITPLMQAPDKGRGLERQSIGSSVLYVDVDAYDNQTSALATLRAYPLPPTMIVSSGNGLHAYWLLDKLETEIDEVKARNKQLAIEINKLDMRADADSCFDLARVLRVPDTYNVKRTPIKCEIIEYHEDRIYRLSDFAPAVLNDNTIEAWDCEPLPADFIETLRERDAKLARRITSDETAKKADAPLNASGGIDRSRNDAYIATRLLALGYTPGIALAVLQHDQWLSGSKYREKMRFDYVVSTVNAALRAYQNSAERYFNKSTFVAERLGVEMQTATPYIYAGERLWRYVSGVYVDDAEAYIKAQTVAKLGNRWSTRARDETIDFIIDQSRTPLERLNNHEGLINCRNGMLDARTGELLPHDPRYLSTAQIPAAFDPNADCTGIDRFFADILPADAIPMMWEYIGSMFLTARYWPKAFLALVGAPDSGKSKLAEWIVLFLGGKTNVTALSLQTLADNKFASSALFGRLANVFSDLDESEAQNTGQIKSLTGDDFTSGEQKFKGFFMFKNAARLLFTANGYPAVRNPDDAFFRRARIIPCRNRFAPNDPRTDPAIVDKMTTDANLSAGLLRAYEGLRRLLENGDFTPSDTVNTANEDYRFAADTVAGFLHTCEADNDAYTPKQQFYAQYRAACEMGGRKPVSEDKFFKRVAENLTRFGITEEYKTLTTTHGEKERVWCYCGRKARPAHAYTTITGAYITLN